MLRLQAKHFEKEAKNKYNKASLDIVKQRNTQLEQQKREERKALLNPG